MNLKTLRNHTKILFTFGIFTIVGCNDINILDKYVEKNITIDTSNVSVGDLSTSFAGNVRFTETHYFTNHRRVCDQYVCGTDSYETCRPERICDNDHTEPPHHNPPVPTPVPGDHPHPPRPRLEIGMLGCHSFPVCQTHVKVRYCDTNCRQEPFTDSTETHFTSPLTIEIQGVDQSNKSLIKKLALGVHTNQAFKAAVEIPSLRPKNSEGLFESVKATDQILLVMQAKGLKLRSTSSLLNLPLGFKKGDPILLQVEVENTSSEMLSAIGTSETLPDLASSDRQ